MITRKQMEQIVEQLKAMREAATDETAETTPALFPTLKQDGGLIKAGTRIQFNGKVYKARVDLWDNPGNDPATADTLWVEVKKQGDYREIPEVIEPALAFSKGEIGIWKNQLYRSLIDNNVWNPEAYPAGWEVVQ